MSSTASTGPSPACCARSSPRATTCAGRPPKPGSRSTFPGRTIAVLDAAGTASCRALARVSSILLPAFQGASYVGTVAVGRAAWRVHIDRISSVEGGYAVVTVGSLDHLAREQQLLARTLLVSIPFAVLLAAAVCWWVASRALRPVTEMAARAEAITLDSLRANLATSAAADELGKLGRAFNHLLERLRTALRTQRQFMADASHELSTPISVARTAAEVTLNQPGRDEAEYRDALQIVGEQTIRLGQMVEDMLTLASADAGGYPVRRSPCTSTSCLASACEVFV